MKKLKLSFLLSLLALSTNIFAVSEASGELSGAMTGLSSAVGNVSLATINLSSEVALTVGEPIAKAIVEIAKVAGVVLSSTVDASGQIVIAGTELSASGAQLSATAIASTAQLSTEAASEVGKILLISARQAAQLSSAIVMTSTELSADAIVAGADLSVAIANGGVEVSKETLQLIKTLGIKSAQFSYYAAEGIYHAGKFVLTHTDDALVFVIKVGAQLIIIPLEVLTEGLNATTDALNRI